jgi:hypothetical protein
MLWGRRDRGRLSEEILAPEYTSPVLPPRPPAPYHPPRFLHAQLASSFYRGAVATCSKPCVPKEGDGRRYEGLPRSACRAVLTLRHGGLLEANASVGSAGEEVHTRPLSGLSARRSCCLARPTSGSRL